MWDVQDYLQGSHNLELDQELQKLQDSCDIVVLKFSAAGSDSVVILWSEFEQVSTPPSLIDSQCILHFLLIAPCLCTHILGAHVAAMPSKTTN